MPSVARRAPRWRRAEAGSRRRAPSTTVRSASNDAAAAPSLRRDEAARALVVLAGSRSRRSPGPAPARSTSSGMAAEIRAPHAEPAQCPRRPARARRSRRRRACAAACRRCRESAANRAAADERRELRDAADAARADRRLVAEVRQRAGEVLRPDAVAEHDGVARILARQRRGDLEPVGQRRRHVLRAVHREVDLVAEQRVLDLLDEQPLAAASTESGASCVDRRVVVMTTSSTARPPPRARSATACACHSASALPRVPIRSAVTTAPRTLPPARAPLSVASPG